MKKVQKSAAGFSLLEVLLAVVILSVGLLALAALQMSLIRSSSGAKMQSTAVSLGKQKIEQLRSFRQLSASGTTGTQNPCSATSNTSYIAMTDCTVTQTVGGVTYTIATTVNRYVLASDAGTYLNVPDTTTESALSADTSHTYVLGRDYKKTSVRVTWTDSTNTANSLTLDDAIDGLNPSDSAKVAKNSSSLAARQVKVIISNPANTAGVIAIPLATGSNEVDTAATNPKPVIDNNATETRFNIYTYAAISGSTTTALAQSEVETVMIGCTCDTAAAPTDTSTRGYRPTYWNGTRYVSPSLTTYVPPAGQYSTKKSSESPYCNICCRDHHDPAGTTTAKFSPWRATHTHYGINSSGALVAVGTNGQTVYKEACRLIRTDGILRVAADYNDEYFNLLKTKNDGSTTEYAPDTTAVGNYQNFVLDYLNNKVVSNGSSSTYNSPVSAATVSTLEASRSINDPASITLQRSNAHKWLHGRGLYIDYLEPEALNAIADAKAGCVSSGCTAAQKQTAVLKLMPFTSINLTELADWSPLVSDNLYVSISNGAFASSTAFYGSAPLRGYVVPATNIPSPAQTQNGTATMRNSNSGLQTLYDYAINNDEGSKSDTQSFSIPAGGGSNNGGNFTVAFNGYDFGTFPALSGTNITQCTKAQVGNGNNATYKYTCQTDSLVSALSLNVQNYNYQAPATTGLTITCTDANGANPLQYTTKNNDPSLVTCEAYNLNSASSNQSGAVTPVVSGSGKSQSASLLFSPVDLSQPTTNPLNLTLTFSGPTTTYAGYTCRYTQTQNGSPKNPTIVSTSANCP
jgi:type IV pilus modification protein PilV